MHSNPGAPPEPSPALVFHTLMAHQQTAALRAAIELDLFRAVGDSPCSAHVLAERHTPTSEAFLDPRSPSCVAATARFMSAPEMRLPRHNGWCLASARQGRTKVRHHRKEPENPVWVEFAHSMAPMMAPVAAPLGAAVLRFASGPMRVLDIAAGHGLFGIQIAKQNPEAHIVAQDWASVLEVAMTNTRQAGVADRYQTLPGSAFDVAYGGPYDAVLLTNFLHHFDPPTCVGLLKKVLAALTPGGIAATLEFVPNEDRVSPPMPAAFSLVMLASTAAGDAYTYRELGQMHREGGFAALEPPIPVGPHTVVVAHAQGSIVR